MLRRLPSQYADQSIVVKNSQKRDFLQRLEAQRFDVEKYVRDTERNTRVKQNCNRLRDLDEYKSYLRVFSVPIKAAPLRYNSFYPQFINDLEEQGLQ